MRFFPAGPSAGVKGGDGRKRQHSQQGGTGRCGTFLLLLLSLAQAYYLYTLWQRRTLDSCPLPSSTSSLPSSLSSPPLPLPLSPPLSQPVSSAGLGRQQESDHPGSKNQNHSRYVGVAATLMLHSPTWFQRRYTFMVQNVANNLPSGWIIQIFYTGKGQSLAGIKINRGLQRMVERGEVILSEIPHDVWSRKRKRFQLLTDRWIWSEMVAEKVLIFGGSAIICSNSPHQLTDFLSFDYIGAPWKAFGGKGGEGGISLRSRSYMMAAIDFELSKSPTDEERQVAFKKWGQEDRFFVSRLLEMMSPCKEGSCSLPSMPRLANSSEAKGFAGVGYSWQEDVWAVSGTLPGLSVQEREEIIAICPEMKIFYPNLHDPHCFGAHPDSELCGNTVCALKPKSIRKGGC
eukprot:gene6127-6746_t